MVIDANPRRFREATFAVTGAMLPLLGLSPVSGEPVVAKFDGGLLSSGRRIMVLREVEQRLGVADRIAANGDACNKISAYAGSGSKSYIRSGMDPSDFGLSVEVSRMALPSAVVV